MIQFKSNVKKIFFNEIITPLDSDYPLFAQTSIQFIRTIQMFFSESSDNISPFLIEMPYPIEMVYHPVVSP